MPVFVVVVCALHLLLFVSLCFLLQIASTVTRLPSRSFNLILRPSAWQTSSVSSRIISPPQSQPSSAENVITMGQTASQPNSDVRLRVIGAGMSRTGTTSFGEALSHLLDGPVYHGGTQLLRSPESHIKQWIEVCKHTPIKSEADRKFVMQNVEQLLSGFVACTDLPSLVFVEELMAIYPDALVVCTVRDPDKWWASMEPVVKKGNLTVLSWILAPLPTLRCFRKFHDVMDDGRFGEIYYRPGETKKPSRVTYDRHIAHLKAVVPKDRLFFYDVRDGWEPLCKILKVDVPKGVEFPKLNDAQAMESFMKASVQRGLLAWAGIGVMTAATCLMTMRYLMPSASLR